jgi:hypothetical protein
MHPQTSEILSAAQALDPERPVDYIVAYPHSSNIELQNGQITPRLSALSRMSIEAATFVQEPHVGSKLVLPGETCFEDTDLPDTTDLFVEYLGDNDTRQSVPLHRTLDGRPLNNTYLQTMGLTEFFNQLPKEPQNVLIETLDYHMTRVRRTAVAYGLKANYVVAEEVLAHKGIDTYDALSPVIARGTRKTEALAYMLTVGDRKGTIMNRVMANSGARLVDVTENPQGELVFENTLAKKKLAVLTAQLAHC